MERLLPFHVLNINYTYILFLVGGKKCKEIKSMNAITAPETTLKPKRKFTVNPKLNTVYPAVKKGDIYNEVGEEPTNVAIEIPYRNNRLLVVEAAKSLYPLRNEVTKKMLGNKPERKSLSNFKNKNKNTHIINELDFTIYTDGGYSTKKEIGTWAFIIQITDHKIPTTLMNWVQGSNSGPIFNEQPGYFDLEDKALIMEMIAVMKAIDVIKQNKHRFNIRDVTVFTDSKNLCNYRVNIDFYKKNDWFNSYKQRFLQPELINFWVSIEKLILEFDIKVNFIKGHAGNYFNEHVNNMCQLRRQLAEEGQMAHEIYHHFIYI